MSSLRIMSFNVRNSSSRADDGVNAWELRRELNVRTIHAHAPDLLGMQETQQDQWEYYREQLSGYACSRGSCEYGNHQCLPLFWKPGAFELTGKGSFWLSPTPETYAPAWDADCVRSANWGRLAPTDRDRREILFLNTHLDHEGPQARLNGARQIVAMLREIRVPGQQVLMTGDFNCDPGSPPHACFLDAGYVDTYLALKKTEGPDDYTFHAFRGARHPKYGRIDWVLSRGDQDGLALRDAQIIRDAEGAVYPSDHYPVLTDFDM